MGETPPGKKPTYAMPVFHLHPSSANDSSKRDDESLSSQKKSYALSGIYDRSFVDAAQSRWTEADGVPRLTQVQKDALDALDATCADDAFRLDMRLEPMVFAPSELVPVGKMYICHRGIALYGGKIMTAGR